MRNTSKWAHRQGKRGQAVAYGCYPPDANPNPLDIDRDARAVESQSEIDDRRESKRILEGIARTSKGKALVGPWEPRG